MNTSEVKRLIDDLRVVFDIVRLVDVSAAREMLLGEDGKLTSAFCHCYAVWGKQSRCEDCISAKALACKGKKNKFEYSEQGVFHVISMYLEVDDKPYLLEMVTRLAEDTLIDVNGREGFVESLKNYRQKLYSDPLTGSFNRRYYEEQLRVLSDHPAVAMLDLDNFKAINDTYGHPAGDLVLRVFAAHVMQHIRETDCLVRMGGDEFLLVMQSITRPSFMRRLEEIRDDVSRIVFERIPDLQATVSIGGVYLPCGTIEDAMHQADALLYIAKTRKNCVEQG